MNVINFLLFLFIYVPLNIIVMLLAALCFSILNKVFALDFPTWIVASAAGVLVFAMLIALVETSSLKQADTDLYYSTTLVINIIVIIAMLTLSGIGKLVFKKSETSSSFSFGTKQKIAGTAYCITVGLLVAMPVLTQGKEYLQDVKTEKYKARIKSIIEENDKEYFKIALENNNDLAELRLDYTTQSLLEYLFAENKTELVDIMFKQKKDLIFSSVVWDINSPEMIAVLINNGMTADAVIEKLTFKNKSGLVKTVIEKYHPSFSNRNLLMVQYITRNVLDYNQNPELFNYLVQHGLAEDTDQSNEAINYFIKKNDFKTVKMLDDNGFKIDTSRHDMMEKAISNENIDMVNLLFKHGFSINRPFNEYTYVEHAIISNSETVIDILLKHKPDVTTLHPTYDEVEINALILAEKYKRPEMLQKLKAYCKS